MKTRCVVIGGGVLGLAIARKLALDGMKPVLLEARSDIGLETSFRNSAVIHAGIYYPSNSLKARLCVAGNKMLYKYSNEKSISHKRIGKLIVATTQAQLAELNDLYKQAVANGVKDVTLINSDEIKALEPNITAIAGLLSPSTGVLNGRELMMAYKKDIELNGGIILTNSKVVKGEVLAQGFRLYYGDTLKLIECAYLVNAAGLCAQEVSHSINGIPQNSIPEIYYAKGNYFKLDRLKSPFSRLIYPIPEKAGLGIHATIDLAGVVRFGPDVEWVNKIDYSVNLDRKDIFLNAIKNYFPAIKSENLIPEYAGIRPKSQPKEMQPQDFNIQSEASHGIPNLVNLYGMESPGLTSSLAIAEEVNTLLFQSH